MFSINMRSKALPAKEHTNGAGATNCRTVSRISLRALKSPAPNFLFRIFNFSATACSVSRGGEGEILSAQNVFYSIVIRINNKLNIRMTFSCHAALCDISQEYILDLLNEYIVIQKEKKEYIATFIKQWRSILDIHFLVCQFKSVKSSFVPKA